MPPRLGLYSLADTPEELLSQGYGVVNTEFADDPTFGGLAYNTVYNPAPYTGAMPFQNVFRINEGQYYGDLDFPSFGGVSGYRDTGGVMSIDPSINQLKNLGFDTSFGVANEPDEEETEQYEVDQFGYRKKSEKQSNGIMDLLMSMAIPGYGLFKNIAKGGLEGLKGFGKRLQQSDFGQSKNLADYLDMRSYGGRDARERAASKTMREARAIQRQVDMRGDSTSERADRNRSSVTTSSAAKSKGVGGGGYTSSDSNRESYRGR